MVETIIKSKFREQVYKKSLAEGRDISQEEIAQATGLRRPTISAWMNMKKAIKRIDSPVLVALAKYANCSPLDLLTVEEVESPEKVA